MAGHKEYVSSKQNAEPYPPVYPALSRYAADPAPWR
jgi:hypothetical protein